MLCIFFDSIGNCNSTFVVYRDLKTSFSQLLFSDCFTDAYIFNCTFDTGDDCIAIKSGKNPEGFFVEIKFTEVKSATGTKPQYMVKNSSEVVH